MLLSDVPGLFLSTSQQVTTSGYVEADTDRATQRPSQLSAADLDALVDPLLPFPEIAVGPNPPGGQLIPDAIYEQGTSADYMARHPDALATLPGSPQAFQFDDPDRWSATTTDGRGLAQGDATILTWSIVPDGTSIFGFTGEPTSDSNLISFLGGIYGVTSNDANLADEPWFPLFQSFLDRWSSVSGISYVYEPNDDGDPWRSTRIAAGQVGIRGDVRISGHFIDGESGSNVLAYNFFPNRGDMVIDTGNPAFFGNTSGNSLRLRNVLAHEQGHGLGIGHVCPVIRTVEGRLMEPFINLNFDGPQFDDLLAVQRGYGDALEKSGGNDTAATATNLGTLLAGQTIERGTDADDNRVSPADIDFISIDDDSDIDFFKFTLGSSVSLNATLTPLGPSYLSGPQNGDSSCSAGTIFDAANQNDLTLALIDTDGATVLQTSNVSGLGGAESIGDVMLAAGTYHARITGIDNAAQTYGLSLAAGQEPGVIVTPSDGNTMLVEAGNTDTYTIALASVPTGSVAITVTADAQTEVSDNGATFSNSVVLTHSDTTPRIITVRAIDDTIDEGLHTSSISHAITSTADPTGYPTSLAIAHLTANIADNDPPAQNASSVVAFSSQWSPTNYSAAQTLGPANVLTYGDDAAAWSASVADGTLEQLTLGFAIPVFANGATVRESWGNGFVTDVEVRNASSGAFVNVFSGEDASAPGSVVDFVVPFPQTTFLVDAIRITIDTDHSTVWEEVDSVQLHGVTTSPAASITVVPTEALTTTEEGGTAILSVVLDTVPAADVILGLSSSDLTEGTVSPASLTFTPGNALTPQTVTVTGVDDDLVDGNIAYTIITAAATSADPNYQGIDAADAVVVNNDNDGGPQLSQHATSVIAFSSQWNSTIYSAAQTLGPADVLTYGDNPNAWAASVPNGTIEFLTLGFETPVFANGVTIRETWGNGFVTDVEVRNASSGAFVNVFSGVDTSAPGSVVDFFLSLPQTAFLVDAIRITLNTDHSTVWEEIDSAELHGVTAPSSAGITVNPTAGLATTEEGGTATFSVVLDTVPTANVTLGLKSSDATEGAVSPAALTFTPANALTPQTVTITGLDDALQDGNIVYTVVTTAAISADPNYGGIDPADVGAVNNDNDGPALLPQPATSVIAFSSQWSPTNYSAAQVLGPPDVLSYGDSVNAWSPSVQDGSTEQLTLGFAIPVFASSVTIRESWGNGFVRVVEVRNASSGEFVNVFAGVDPSAPGNVVEFVVPFSQTTFLVDAIRVTIDTDHSTVWEEVDSVLLHGVAGQAGFTVTETGNGTSVTEGGTTDTFSVVLDTQPSSDVVIDVTSSDLGEATVSLSRLTFTSANWATPQNVTITGIDDDVTDGEQVTTITLSIDDANSDDDFDAVADQTVSVTTADNDAAGFTIIETGGGTAVSESGTTDTFSVVLDTQPNSNVVITVTSGDPGEATVVPSLLAFSPDNWDTPQIVTVTGVDDNVVDGSQTTTVTLSIDDANSDDHFDALADQTVSVVTIDNDTGFTLIDTGDATSVWERKTQTACYPQRQRRPLNRRAVDLLLDNDATREGLLWQLDDDLSTGSIPWFYQKVAGKSIPRKLLRDE